MKLVLRILFAALLLTFAYVPSYAADADDSVPVEFFGGNAGRFGDHWYLIIEDSLAWGRAKHESDTLGASLAAITSEQEEAFVESLNTNGLSLWTGAICSGSSWTWVSREAWNYSCWNPDVSSADSGSRGILTSGGWSFRNYSDSSDINGYLLEFDTEEAYLAALHILDLRASGEYASVSGTQTDIVSQTPEYDASSSSAPLSKGVPIGVTEEDSLDMPLGPSGMRNTGLLSGLLGSFLDIEYLTSPDGLLLISSGITVIITGFIIIRMLKKPE